MNYDDLYLSFVEAIAHIAGLFSDSLLEGPIYHNQIIRPAVQNVLNNLCYSGVINNYNMDIIRSCRMDAALDLVIHINKGPVSYNTYHYPLSMFSADIIAVAKVMVS